MIRGIGKPFYVLGVFFFFFWLMKPEIKIEKN